MTNPRALFKYQTFTDHNLAALPFRSPIDNPIWMSLPKLSTIADIHDVTFDNNNCGVVIKEQRFFREDLHPSGCEAKIRFTKNTFTVK